jgi:hypothetical protein
MQGLPQERRECVLVLERLRGQAHAKSLALGRHAEDDILAFMSANLHLVFHRSRFPVQSGGGVRGQTGDLRHPHPGHFLSSRSVPYGMSTVSPTRAVRAGVS